MIVLDTPHDWGKLRKMKQMNLLLETRRLAIASTLTRDQIARGANVDRDWLNKVCQGRIASPGVVLVQRLHDFLAAESNRT